MKRVLWVLVLVWVWVVCVMGLEAFPVEMTTSFDTPGTELYTLPTSPISPLLASNMDASGRTVTVVCDESNSATSWVVVTAPNGTVTITALNTHPAFLIDPLSRCADTSTYPQNNTHSAHACGPSHLTLTHRPTSLLPAFFSPLSFSLLLDMFGSLFVFGSLSMLLMGRCTSQWFWM